MPVIHSTDLFEVEVDDESPNILYIRHKENKKIELTLWPENDAQGGMQNLVLEPGITSKMELAVNGEQPNVLVVPL